MLRAGLRLEHEGKSLDDCENRQVPSGALAGRFGARSSRRQFVGAFFAGLLAARALLGILFSTVACGTVASQKAIPGAAHPPVGMESLTQGRRIAEAGMPSRETQFRRPIHFRRLRPHSAGPHSKRGRRSRSPHIANSAMFYRTSRGCEALRLRAKSLWGCADERATVVATCDIEKPAVAQTMLFSDVLVVPARREGIKAS